MTRVINHAGWVLLTIGALLIAVLSSRYFLLGAEVAAPPPLLAMVSGRTVTFLLHVGGGIIALAAGAWNFLEWSRVRYLNLHRWLGRIYLVSVLVGGLAGLSLAITAQGGLAGKFGFGMLAILWIVTAVFAYRRIRQFDIESHRRWMIRNYALTFAAVTLRIWLPVLSVAGSDFRDSYPAVAWLCWVPNLIVAEWLASRQTPIAAAA
jgi:uncharacterized membrane protein